jgi:hypothetical protein
MPDLLPTVVETSVFRRKAEKLLTSDEYDDLLLYLSRYYAAGDEIPARVACASSGMQSVGAENRAE